MLTPTVLARQQPVSSVIKASLLLEVPGVPLVQSEKADAKQYLLVVSAEHYIFVYAAPSLVLLHTIDISQDGSATVTALAALYRDNFGFISADSKGILRRHIIFADGTIQMTLLPALPCAGIPISALASSPHHTFLAIGTDQFNAVSLAGGNADAIIFIYDYGNSESSSIRPIHRTYMYLHSDLVTSLAFHPVQANLLLSASSDGLLTLTDINHVEEEDAAKAVLSLDTPLNNAQWMSEVSSDGRPLVFAHSDMESITFLSIGETAVEEDPGCSHAHANPVIDYSFEVIHNVPSLRTTPLKYLPGTPQSASSIALTAPLVPPPDYFMTHHCSHSIMGTNEGHIYFLAHAPSLSDTVNQTLSLTPTHCLRPGIDSNTDTVRALVFDPANEWAISLAEDGKIIAWDLSTADAKTKNSRGLDAFQNEVETSQSKKSRH